MKLFYIWLETFPLYHHIKRGEGWSAKESMDEEYPCMRTHYSVGYFPLVF
jgi:hypothetical protein